MFAVLLGAVVMRGGDSTGTLFHSGHWTCFLRSDLPSLSLRTAGGLLGDNDTLLTLASMFRTSTFKFQLSLPPFPGTFSYTFTFDFSPSLRHEVNPNQLRLYQVSARCTFIRATCSLEPHLWRRASGLLSERRILDSNLRTVLV